MLQKYLKKKEALHHIKNYAQVYSFWSKKAVEKHGTDIFTLYKPLIRHIGTFYTLVIDLISTIANQKSRN